MLRGHTSLVKGVTWDPIGKYLATQSDDKTLIVWRTSDWVKERAIAEPFKEANGTTHVLRLSWSPDGTYLVSIYIYYVCHSWYSSYVYLLWSLLGKICCKVTILIAWLLPYMWRNLKVLWVLKIAVGKFRYCLFMPNQLKWSSASSEYVSGVFFPLSNPKCDR